MSRENGDEGDLRGLWADDERPIPLATAVAPRSAGNNGDQPSSAAPTQPRRTSAGELTAERMLRTATEAPPSGWRRTVFRITGGLVDVGPGPGEQRERELRSRVKTPVAGCRRIAFLSRKGGVG